MQDRPRLIIIVQFVELSLARQAALTRRVQEKTWYDSIDGYELTSPAKNIQRRRETPKTRHQECVLDICRNPELVQPFADA